jgi:hypothetical protein
LDVVGCIRQDAACFVWGGIAVSDSADRHETLTFVVRLWRAEHVGSQEVGYVEDVAGVARFIERWTRLEAEESPIRA